MAEKQHYETQGVGKSDRKDCRVENSDRKCCFPRGVVIYHLLQQSEILPITVDIYWNNAIKISDLKKCNGWRISDF